VADVERFDIADVVVPVASPVTLIRTGHTHLQQDAIDRAFPEATALIFAGQYQIQLDEQALPVQAVSPEASSAWRRRMRSPARQTTPTRGRGERTLLGTDVAVGCGRK